MCIQDSKLKYVICNKGNLILHFQTSKKNEMSILTKNNNYVESCYSTCVPAATDPRYLAKVQIMDFQIQ